jgi:DNA (cytosine-5)-methyltransferase 1
MTTYFNEIDPYPAGWLRGAFPGSMVDERSIADVGAEDVAGAERAHFFAGIGGWELALDLAGWDRGRPVWTGSCPCQPFSAAGRQGGASDERHLWPEFFRLIRECRPGVVFGEQVASAVGHGWLDAVASDVEGIGYAFAAAVLGAHSVGAPHLRQRIYWVASADAQRPRGTGLVAGADTRAVGPWAGCRDTDMRSLIDAPFEPGDRWPQPLLRRMDDGVPGRLDRLRAFGNAIVPQTAAEFVMAYMETEGEA